MPQVPYAPVPAVEPSSQAIQGPQVNAPIEAFGGAVGAAISHLGNVTEQAGNELFARAYAMQELKNETEAKDADVQFMISAGEVHAKYNELQGQDRVNAFPKYSQDLQDLYRTHRSALSNPMSQRMFDASAVSTLSRSIFNGAGAAATAQREASLGAANSEFELNAKNVYNDPNDEAGFRDAIDRNDKSAVSKAAMSAGGATPERVALIKQQGRSTLAYNRVVGMSRNEPNKAYQLEKQYEDEGLLFGNQAIQAQDKVRSMVHTVGMNAVADQVLGKHKQTDGTFDKSFVDLQQEAKDTATKMYPDDPQIGVAAAAALDRNYNQLKWAKTQDDHDVQQQLNEYVVKGAASVDLLPRDLVERMTPAQIKAYPAAANAYRRSQDVQTNQAQYTQLLGLYNNDNAKFMDTNVLATPGLSKSNIDFFLGLQRKAAASGDPRVSRAQGMIRGASAGQLQELGIFKRDTSNTDDYDRYTGALHEAIQAFQETNGKPPNEAQITKEIFPAVIRQITVPGRFFGTNQTEFFKSEVPETIREQAEKQKGSELTNPELQQLRSDYMRAQFNQLFGQSKKKTEGRVQ